MIRTAKILRLFTKTSCPRSTIVEKKVEIAYWSHNDENSDVEDVDENPDFHKNPEHVAKFSNAIKCEEKSKVFIENVSVGQAVWKIYVGRCQAFNMRSACLYDVDYAKLKETVTKEKLAGSCSASICRNFSQKSW